MGSDDGSDASVPASVGNSNAGGGGSDSDDSDNNAANNPANAANNGGIHDDAYRTGELWMHDFVETEGPLLHDRASEVSDIYNEMLTGGNPGGPDDVVNLLVTETNRYAQQYKDDHPTNKAATSWKPVTQETMKAFLAIVLYMGMVNLPTLQMYWNTHWIFSFSIADIMSRNDFLAILKFLHCANNTLMIARNQPGYDRLFKIRDITDMFVRNWQRCYYPSREISLDECIVGFKGRTYLKQTQKSHTSGVCVCGRCQNGIHIWLASICW